MGRREPGVWGILNECLALGRLQINICLRRRQVGDPGRRLLAAFPIAMETWLRLPWQLGKPLGPA